MTGPKTRIFAVITLLLSVVLVSASVAPPAVARAPKNDKFGNALKIGSLPYHHEQSTVRAKLQDSDPVLTNCPNEASHTVWYKLKPRNTDTAIDADTFGSGFDTVLAAFEQTGSGVVWLVQVACNDDTNGVQSEVTFTANANTTYYFHIGTCCTRDDSTAEGGNLEFNVRLGG